MNRNIHSILKYIFSFAVAVMFLNISSANARAIYVHPLFDSINFIKLNFDNSNGAKLVECYPNPATAYINFKFDNSVARTSKLFIYSFTGKQMNVVNVTDNVIKIPLENYYRGLYMYQLRDANGNFLESGKFQVKN